MTARDVRYLGAGWMAGCVVATLACLASIWLETRAAQNRQTPAKHREV